MDQKFNDTASNFFVMKNLADLKSSFNPFQKQNKNVKEKENYIIAYVNGSAGAQVDVMYSSFKSKPDSVTINGTDAKFDSKTCKVSLTINGKNPIKNGVESIC